MDHRSRNARCLAQMQVRHRCRRVHPLEGPGNREFSPRQHRSYRPVPRNYRHQLRIHRYRVRVLRVTYQGNAMDEPLTIVSDKRRPLPPYAKVFCEMLAAHVRDGFPLPGR